MLPEIPYRFLAVEGNIGSGKTQLAKALAFSLQADILLEEFDQNPHIRPFYEGEASAIYPLEHSLRANRYQLMKSYFAQDPSLRKPVLVSDFHPLKSKIFAQVNLSLEEQKKMDIQDPFRLDPLEGPDLLILLRVPLEDILHQIHSRGRPYESQISPSYLQRIDQGYISQLGYLGPRTLMVYPHRLGLQASELAKYLISFLQGKRDRKSFPVEVHWYDPKAKNGI